MRAYAPRNSFLFCKDLIRTTMMQRKNARSAAPLGVANHPGRRGYGDCWGRGLFLRLAEGFRPGMHHVVFQPPDTCVQRIVAWAVHRFPRMLNCRGSVLNQCFKRVVERRHVVAPLLRILCQGKKGGNPSGKGGRWGRRPDFFEASRAKPFFLNLLPAYPMMTQPGNPSAAKYYLTTHRPQV